MVRATALMLLLCLLGCKAHVSGDFKLRKDIELDPSAPLEAIDQVGIRVRIPF